MRKQIQSILVASAFLALAALGILSCSSSGGSEPFIPDTPDKPVESLTLNQTTISLRTGEQRSITATIKPSEAATKSIAWHSTNPSVASVSPASGTTVMVTAISGGETTIIALAEGKMAQCSVKVAVPVTGVTITPLLTLAPNATGWLDAVVLPTNATNQELDWVSSNPSVATVTANLGTRCTVLSGANSGSATIFAVTKDGAKTAQCLVTVSGAASQNPTSAPQIADYYNRIGFGGEQTFGIKGTSGASAQEIEMAYAIGGGLPGPIVAAPVPALKWNVYSSDTATLPGSDIATIDEDDGILKTKAEGGDVYVRVAYASSPTVLSTAAKITIQQAFANVGSVTLLSSPSDIRPMNTMSLVWSESQAQPEARNRKEIIAYVSFVTPAGVSTPTGMNTNVIWSSSDPSTVVVQDSNGRNRLGQRVPASQQTFVRLVKDPGATPKDVTITVTTENGNKTASCKVSVTQGFVPLTMARLDDLIEESPVGDSGTITLAPGGTQQLNLYTVPSNATDKRVQMWFYDPAVVNITLDGLVTAVANGNTTVYAYMKDGNLPSSTRTIEVVSNSKNVSSVAISPTALKLAFDSANVTKPITATVLPADAASTDVVWSTSNPGVAELGVPLKTANATTVNVTAKDKGRATITATTRNGGKVATCEVTVGSTAKEEELTALAISPTTLSLTVGGQPGALTCTPEPASATPSLTWSSSNEAVATVSATGVVTAVSAGSANITAKSPKSSTNSTVVTSNACAVTVSASTETATGITITPATATIEIEPGPTYFTGSGDTTVDLTATVTKDPSGNHSNQNVTWTPNPTGVVTLGIPVVTPSVSSKVTVSADKPGSTTITATSQATPPQTANKVVIVKGVKIEAVGTISSINDTAQLTATTYGSIGSVSWSVAPSGVATVSSASGTQVTVTATGAGNAIVTATAGSYKDTYNVSVASQSVDHVTITPPASSIIEPPGDKYLVSGTGAAGTVALTAKVYKSSGNASSDEHANQNVTWRSSDTSIATVNASGVVTAVAPGTANIIARSVATTETDSAPVAITVSGIVLNPWSASIRSSGAGNTQVINATLNGNATGAVNWTSASTLGAANANIGGSPQTGASVTVTGATDTEIITVAATAGAYKSEAVVEVNDVAVTGVTLTTTSAPAMPITVVGTLDTPFDITAAVLPSNASQGVTWELVAGTNVPTGSGAAVIDWTSSGNTCTITPRTSGTATIRVKSNSDTTKEDTYVVTVAIPVTSVTMNQNAADCSAGLTVTAVTAWGSFDATVAPPTAPQAVTWSKDEPGTAVTFNTATQKITANGAGVVTIKVESSTDSTKFAQCVVTGVALELTPPSLSLTVGDTPADLAAPYTYGASGSDVVTSDTNCTWNSDSSAVDVTTKGKVNPVSATTGATVTVTYTIPSGMTANGQNTVTATCNVDVTGPSTVDVASVSLPSAITLGPGADYTITAAILPANADDKTAALAEAVASGFITITSIAADPITGNPRWTITPVAPGTATVTVTTTDQGKTANCTVTVVGLTVTPTSLPSMTFPGGTEAITATYNDGSGSPPSDVTATCSWTVTDSSTDVVTVAGGVVTPAGTGNKTVRATYAIPVTTDNSVANVTADCAVTVSGPGTVHVASVSLPSAITLGPGADYTITAAISPANADVKTAVLAEAVASGFITITPTTPDTITGDPRWTITPVAPGTATVTVTTTDQGETANCTVTVVGLTVSPTSLPSMTFPGGTEAITATYNDGSGNPPSDVTAACSWTVTDSSTDVVTVAGGVVTPAGTGNKTVRATYAIPVTTDNSVANVTADCTVTVSGPGTVHVASVSLPSAITLGPGADYTITAAISPANADIKTAALAEAVASGFITITPTTPDTITGDPRWTITPVAPGTATVTVTTTDQGETDTCTVTVVGLTVTPGSFAMTYPAASAQSLTATYNNGTSTSPVTATCTWSVVDSSTNVVTVSNALGTEGQVTSTGLGTNKIVRATYTIPVTTDNGVTVATADSTVTAVTAEPATSVTFEADGNPIANLGSFEIEPPEIGSGDTASLTAVVNTANGLHVNPEVTWSTTDATIASLSNTSATTSAVTLTGLKPGTSTIAVISTATNSLNAAVTSSATVTVKGITITGSVTVAAGAQITLTANLFGTGVGPASSLTWSTESDDGGVTDDDHIISGQGSDTLTFEGMASGETVIVTVTDGTYTATFEVTVS